MAAETNKVELSEEEKSCILHALGFSRKRRWSYRNIYYGQWPACDNLVELGYMVSFTRQLDLSSGIEETMYRVTDAGIDAVGIGHKVRKEDRY